MGSSAFGKGTKSNNSSYTPPDGAQPLFKKTASDLLRRYNNGEGGNVYKGQRTGDLGDITKNSINGLLDTANRFNNGYLNSLINQKSSSENNLKDLASGKLIGNNGAFKQALNNTLDDAATTVNRQMSGAGRYGSGANNAILANKLGNIAQNANAQQYNQDVNNMMHANSQIDSSRMNQIGNWMNYLNSKGNAYNKALGGGQILDKNQQDKLNSDKDQWEEKDNKNWNRLKMLEQLLNGAAGRYGNTNSTTHSNNNMLGGLGGMLGKLIGK